jgi:hypothetical protein
VKKYLGPILLHFLKDSFAVRGPASKKWLAQSLGVRALLRI